MATVLALLSKSFFEKQLIEGELHRVDDYFIIDTYESQSKRLQKLLKAGGDLILVTVRPNDKLWVVAYLQNVQLRGKKGFVGDRVAMGIRNITKPNRKKLQFESGKGLSAEKGKLAMSLQTPRVLTRRDVELLLGDTAPKVAPKKTAPKKSKARKTTTGTAPSFAAHSGSVNAVLRTCFARFDTLLPKAAASRKTLRKHEYTPHDPAVLFDTHYGGLAWATQMFDGSPPVETWSFDDAYAWAIGPSACLESGTHSRPRGDQAFLDFYGDVLQLVPVAYGPQDDIYYVDAVGRGYYHDTCYDIGGPHLVAANPTQLFARIVLTSWLLSSRFRCASRKGHKGINVAKRLKLEPISEACGEMEEWWGDGLTIVVDRIPFPGETTDAITASTWAATEDEKTRGRIAKILK